MTFKEENIVNIAMRAAELLKDHKIERDVLTGHAGLTEAIIVMASEFEQLHAGTDWNAIDAPDYWEAIDSFAEDRLLEHYGIERDENTPSASHEQIYDPVSVLPVSQDLNIKVIIDNGVVDAVLKDQEIPVRVEVVDVNNDYEDYEQLSVYRGELMANDSFVPCDFSVSNFEEEPDFAQPPVDPVCVLAVSAGGVRRLVYSGTLDECRDFCEENNWEFKDENDFVWELETEDTRLVPPHLRPSWGQIRQEESARPSLTDRIQDAQGRKEHGEGPMSSQKDKGR